MTNFEAVLVGLRVPRFYFHLYNDLDVVDREGEDLSDLADARQFAVNQARGMAGENIKQHGRIDLKHRIDIEDESNSVLESVSFGDAITILR